MLLLIIFGTSLFCLGAGVGAFIVDYWAKKDIAKIQNEWRKRFQALVDRIDTLKDNRENK